MNLEGIPGFGRTLVMRWRRIPARSWWTAWPFMADVMLLHRSHQRFARDLQRSQYCWTTRRSRAGSLHDEASCSERPSLCFAAALISAGRRSCLSSQQRLISDVLVCNYFQWCYPETGLTPGRGVSAEDSHAQYRDRTVGITIITLGCPFDTCTTVNS